MAPSKKTHPVTLHLSDAEHEKALRRMKSGGYKSLNVYFEDLVEHDEEMKACPVCRKIRELLRIGG